MSHGPAKHANPEIAALEAQWWKDWWAQDFSWEGLKAKAISEWESDAPSGINPVYYLDGLPDDNNGQVKLAELFLREENHLIPEPGTTKLWTRFHCPYVFADGTLSPKANWSEEVWADIYETILQLDQNPHRPNHIWLTGMVLKDLPQVGTEVEVSGVQIGASILAQWTHILNTAFLPKRFLRLTTSHAWFSNAVIASQTSSAFLNFDLCTIVGIAAFREGSASYFANFKNTRFLGLADFTKFQFGSTSTGADFSGARFSDKAEFSEVRFAHEAIFNGAKFGGRTNFYAAAFEDRALFDDVECLENIHFYKAAFVRRLTISRSVFYRKLNLEGITDGDPIALSPQPVELTVTETDGKSIGLSGELKPSVGPTTQSYRVLPKLIAEDAVFHYDANFSNRDIISPSSIENARFYHWARFHGSALHPNVSLHNTRFTDALAFRPSRIVTPPEALLRLRFMSQTEETDFHAWKKAFLKARLETHKAEFDYDSYYDGLEASYRTLKQTMEDRRDRIREGEFFMYELRARRKRHDVPLWETAASWLYWGASDYGNSIFRPLILMAVMFVGLAFVYFGLAEKAFYTGTLTFPLNPDQGPRLWQAFGFSLNNAFSPFSALDPSKIAPKDEWTNNLLLSPDAGFSLQIKVIATAQSLLTLVLAFLAGLAGRRRFQIN